MARLTPPGEIKKQIPADSFPLRAREVASKILNHKDPRLAILTGPCSIHDPKSALEYAQRLKDLSFQVADTLFLIMRVFIEKPRSQEGWRGILYDPLLDGSYDMEMGIRTSRSLLRDIAALGVPCAVEILDPLSPYYLDDLITWGMIGARTSASPIHRHIASGLPFPIGFKNDLLGRIQPALSGALVARRPQSHLGIDSCGHLCSIQTQGNPFSHIVLRGSDQGSNYDAASLESALLALQKSNLEPRLLIDCAHGNSGKNLEAQKAAFFNIIEKSATSQGIAGVMLESHLKSGKQAIGENTGFLEYGVSITDPCLSWEDTEEMIRWAACLRARKTIKR